MSTERSNADGRPQGPVIIAIDGPAGVGKSTVARQLAKRMRLPMIDTGAMYRTVALKALLTGIDPDDGEALAQIADEIDLELRADSDGGVEVFLDGEAVGSRIRTPEVTEAASRVSVHGAVRRRMVDVQRRAADRNGGVLEGRDIGTVVFPHTPYKFFLTARAQVRAERRHRDLVAEGLGTSVHEVLKVIVQRDQRDSERKDSPLSMDDTYFEIDSSDLRPPEIVERMVGAIRRRRQELAGISHQPSAVPPDFSSSPASSLSSAPRQSAALPASQTPSSSMDFQATSAPRDEDGEKSGLAEAAEEVSDQVAAAEDTPTEAGSEEE